MEFQQHQAFIRSVEERIHTLRSMGKHDAGKRLEQQYGSLKVSNGKNEHDEM